jgi:hypothetical protein
MLDLVTIVGWGVGFLVGTAVGLILYARWHYGTLEGLGIPVMKPFLFLGSNYIDPYVRPREEEVRRLEKYGMVYGVSYRPLAHAHAHASTLLLYYN